MFDNLSEKIAFEVSKYRTKMLLDQTCSFYQKSTAIARMQQIEKIVADPLLDLSEAEIAALLEKRELLPDLLQQIGDDEISLERVRSALIIMPGTVKGVVEKLAE